MTDHDAVLMVLSEVPEGSSIRPREVALRAWPTGASRDLRAASLRAGRVLGRMRRADPALVVVIPGESSYAFTPAGREEAGRLRSTLYSLSRE